MQNAILDIDSRMAMGELPKQQRTFFFSDIEGSTRLAQQLGEVYVGVLERYTQTIRTAIARYGGQEIDTAGDGFFAAFAHPGEAMLAAAMVQKVLSKEDWAKEANLKARIGLHSGEAVAISNRFIGLEVHKAARVCSAAHGQQVLVSASTEKLLGENLPNGLSLRKLGAFLLKDFDQPEDLYQLFIPGLPGDFPRPRTSIPRHTIAVMPFDNLNLDPSLDYFGQGISEEIIIALGKIPNLRVVARAHSFALDGENLAIGELGTRMQATAILEGAVRRMEDRVRITAELIDVESGYNLWSASFNRHIEDVFSIQDEIADQVAQALKVKVNTAWGRGIQGVQTSNVLAYDYYLRGRKFYYQFTQQGVKFALQMFRKAVEEDNSYALAYSGLADCYSFMYMYHEASPENLDAASQASQRAIDLDPFLAESHASRGVALSLEKRYEESEAEFKRALSLDPRLFEAWYHYGRVSFVQGKLEQAARQFEKAHRVRPEDYQSLFLVGQVYDDLRMDKEAEEARLRGVQIAEENLRLNPGDTRALSLGANGLIILGQRKKALEWVQRALALEPKDALLLYNAGCIYALAGMKEQALNCLERAYGEGLTQLGWFVNDSNLDSLEGHPRFEALIEKMK
ncbi:MAG: adenylate/guanylate cyclase domain-containing protein [Saprospiraceae bacterium]|nr:adenylate/guanylate cyclase domain-containing protein [Saprospiraceae bacterium]